MSVQSTNNKIACCSNSAVSTIGTTTLLLGFLIASVGAVAMIALKMGLPSSNFLAFGNAIGNYGAIAMMSAGGLSLLVSIACAAVLIKRSCAQKPTTQSIGEETNHHKIDDKSKQLKQNQFITAKEAREKKTEEAARERHKKYKDKQIVFEARLEAAAEKDKKLLENEQNSQTPLHETEQEKVLSVEEQKQIIAKERAKLEKELSAMLSPHSFKRYYGEGRRLLVCKHLNGKIEIVDCTNDARFLRELSVLKRFEFTDLGSFS